MTFHFDTMRDLNEIYHQSYENWVHNQLEPEDQYMRRYYPPRPVTALAEKMAAAEKYPPRTVIDEAEQTRKEDEYLKKHGVL